MLSSRVILAEEALDWGLVNQIHPAEQLLDATIDYARNLAGSVGRDALRVSRQMVHADLHRDIGASVEESMAELDRMMGSVDYREGVAALMEKRPPRF